MTSVQERLQIKREPLDKWSIREQLCLAFAVAKSGDQNWMSVSRMLKPLGEPNRPVDWFHQKNCASQYGSLLENVETPKRKKRVSSMETTIETPVEVILKKLTRERIAELDKYLIDEQQEYIKIQEEMTLLQSGNVSEELLDKWCKDLDEEERKKEEESIKHSQWLKERELRKQEIERAWRPFPKVPCLSIPKRKASDGTESSADGDTNEETSNAQPSTENTKPALSPLLTSLLKSPSQVQGGVTSSILHSVITNQRPISVSSNSTITNLLNATSDLNISQNVHTVTSAITRPQDIVATPESVSSDAIPNDLLQDAVDTLPNIKVEDLESTILSSDDPLPEIKNEEVEVIISDLIQNADIVTNPEQHLNLDDNVDIITNLDNELQVLCDEEKAAEEAAAKAAAEAAAKEEAAKDIAEREKIELVEKISTKSSTKVDPFEFEEDPDISQVEKPSFAKQYQPPEENVQQSQSPVISTEPKKEMPEEEDSCKQGKSEVQVPGSVEIVEVVVMEETHIDRELNKTQIQDIVHSVKVEEPEVFPENNLTPIKLVEEGETSIPQPIVDVSSDVSSKPEIVEQSAATRSTTEVPEEKSTNDELKPKEEETKSPTTIAFSSDFSESFFDDLEVNKQDKSSGKAKRDYSRTKKRETEKDFDVLLAIEKVVNSHIDTSEVPDDTSDESDKKYETFKPKIKGESNDRSSSPWTEEEEVPTIRNKRRYSTPATPNDSIPNSPASSSTYFEDEREYKNWKKAIMLFYNRLTTHKYSSMFLKPITDDMAPGYHSLIYKPMDLTTVRKNIESGAIRTTQELQRDVSMMFTNAIMYNKTNQFIYNVAIQMQQETMQQLKLFMQAQQGDVPTRRETRTSEPTKRKRFIEDNNLSRAKKRKEEL